jgi:hypothetical protein
MARSVSMSKYDPLTEHLRLRHEAEVRMRFSEIESVLGFRLPPSSRQYRACWSNHPSSGPMVKSWLAAGYQSRDVDMAAERLVFVRLTRVGAAPNPAGRLAIFGAMKGMIRVAPGVDLTAPADPDWADALDHMASG